MGTTPDNHAEQTRSKGGRPPLTPREMREKKVPRAVVGYRQELRRLTGQAGFPSHKAFAEYGELDPKTVAGWWGSEKTRRDSWANAATLVDLCARHNPRMDRQRALGRLAWLWQQAYEALPEDFTGEPVAVDAAEMAVLCGDIASPAEAATQRELVDLRRQLPELQDEIVELRRQLTAAGNHADELRHRVATLQHELRDARERETALSEQQEEVIVELRRQLPELQDEIAELRRQLTAAGSYADELRHRVAALEHELRDARERETALSEQQEEVIVELRRQLTAAGSHADELRRQLTAANGNAWAMVGQAGAAAWPGLGAGDGPATGAGSGYPSGYSGTSGDAGTSGYADAGSGYPSGYGHSSYVYAALEQDLARAAADDARRRAVALARYLIDACLSNRVSIRDLAHATGANPETIERLLTATHLPDRELVLTVGRACHADPDRVVALYGLAETEARFRNIVDQPADADNSADNSTDDDVSAGEIEEIGADNPGNPPRPAQAPTGAESDDATTAKNAKWDLRWWGSLACVLLAFGCFVGMLLASIAISDREDAREATFPVMNAVVIDSNPNAPGEGIETTTYDLAVTDPRNGDRFDSDLTLDEQGGLSKGQAVQVRVDPANHDHAVPVDLPPAHITPLGTAWKSLAAGTAVLVVVALSAIRRNHAQLPRKIRQCS